jgi:DNA-binding XRE family transcriptional regulator
MIYLFVGYRYKHIKDFRKRTKQRAVEAMGGKCVICGYNKSNSALDFHHLDPKEKDFTVSQGIKSWSKIVEELKKCVLLCCRCHREVHEGLIALPKKYATFNKEYENYKISTTIVETPCIVCQKMKSKHRKTCSYSCSAKLSGKVDWDSVDLLGLLKTRTKISIAKELGVTATAVTKREKKLLNISKKSISQEDFLNLISIAKKDLSTKDLSDLLGVSKTTILKWINKKHSPDWRINIYAQKLKQFLLTMEST